MSQVRTSPNAEICCNNTKNLTQEPDIEDFLDVFVVIKAFPTYIIFKNGEELERVEGVDFEALEKMVAAHSTA